MKVKYSTFLILRTLRILRLSNPLSTIELTSKVEEEAATFELRINADKTKFSIVEKCGTSKIVKQGYIRSRRILLLRE